LSFKVLRAPDLSKLWHDVVRWHLYKEEVDLYLGIGTNLNSVILEADSAEYDLNLQDLWLNKARWTRLIREYIDPLDLTMFVRNSREIFHVKGKSGVITNMPFRPVERRGDLRRHKWGNCLLAATFRGTPSSDVIPTLTLHSRVSYNGYMLGLDMGIAHHLAREITGGLPSEVRVQWHLDVTQLHSFKSLPYLYTQPDLMAVLNKIEHMEKDDPFLADYPTWKSISRWWWKVKQFEEEGKTIEEEIYGPFRRIRKRYAEFQVGKLVPDVPISELDFSKLGGDYSP
jgi:hypothetical protein